MCYKTDATSTSFPFFGLLKRASCVLLIFFTVSATVFTEASKVENGTYPYNTFVIPCAVEASKLAFSSYMLISTRLTRTAPKKLGFTLQRFAAYAFPALCYFVSNNCMFYIIRHLGATTFQIMNNLKVLSTGVFMYVFLNRKLSWLQWKALIILVVGCMVTQLSETENEASLADSRSSLLVGYILVLTSAVASGAGGAFSEKLLKGKGFEQWGLKDSEDSIHWQNIQLYVFGLFFGLVSLRMDENGAAQAGRSVFHGFNTYAYATVTTLSVCGLLVSFILKYLDNVAKCFCAALSMLCVALLDSAMKHQAVPLRMMLGIVLTGLALEQYNLS